MLILLLLFGGCSSNQTAEDSLLPWNKPAPWESRRDISTSLHFHKEYKPRTFTREKIRDDQNRVHVTVDRMMPATSEALRSRVISNEPEFFSKPQKPISVSVIKEFPIEPQPYNFSKKE
ncbi:MAG: hypothetical protein LBH08_00460 [Puniceicoccales bacterium]|jgi:hypothetical protein|nr:hypothetical protein [Puniceicoccales bacterium]